jgi:hypothetical protein
MHFFGAEFLNNLWARKGQGEGYFEIFKMVFVI